MADTTFTKSIPFGGSAGGANGGASSGNGGSGGESPGAAVPQRAYVTGVSVALGAILMFFAALVSAFIVRRATPYGDWHALAARPLFWGLLAFNTVVLLASSGALYRARRRFRAGDEAEFRRWWNVTVFLGVLFLAGQLVAWRMLAVAGVYLATNPSSTYFYFFTAAHGLHLLGGIVALLVIAIRPVRRLARGTAIDVVSIYWHFMDGIWIVLFLVLFLGNRA